MRLKVPRLIRFDYVPGKMMRGPRRKIGSSASIWTVGTIQPIVVWHQLGSKRRTH
jgi:hypothetical protein